MEIMDTENINGDADGRAMSERGALERGARRVTGGQGSSAMAV